MSALSNGVINRGQNESPSPIKIHFLVSVLALMGIATLVMQRMLSTDAGFFRIFGIVAAVCLGFFGYKWVYEQSDMQAKKEHPKEVVQTESSPPPTAAKPQEQQAHVPQPKSTMQTSGSVAKHQNKQVQRKKFSPNANENLIGPPQVFYLNGIPKDVGFGRGDQQQMIGIWLSAKIYIPEIKGYSFIGRILGPRGISVRRLEAETECKILIRGRGSIKDEKREQTLMNRNGWAHLHDKLHVLLLANDESEKQCRERLEYAIQVIQRLLIPQYDEYKRRQLVHLAILNGTYRP